MRNMLVFCITACPSLRVFGEKCSSISHGKWIHGTILSNLVGNSISYVHCTVLEIRKSVFRYIIPNVSQSNYIILVNVACGKNAYMTYTNMSKLNGTHTIDKNIFKLLTHSLILSHLWEINFIRNTCVFQICYVNYYSHYYSDKFNTQVHLRI